MQIISSIYTNLQGAFSKHLSALPVAITNHSSLFQSLVSPQTRTYSQRPLHVEHLNELGRISQSPTSKNLRICFVHTPMSSVVVPGRDQFWTNFDKRYYAVHPELKPADAGIWELPHWMTWLGGVLKSAGYSHVKALDLYTAVNLQEGINQRLISREIESNPADVYLYSPMTPNLHYAYEIAALVKNRWPESKNIFGGIIATPLHKEVAAHPVVDYVVRDRGEIALPRLLERIENNEPVEDVKNLTFKGANGDLSFSNDLYPYIDLSELPFPYVDLFPKHVGDKLRYIRQNYALGCPFKCSFCTIQTIGRKPGYFSTDRVIAEIKAYREHYGEHHNIYFGDETFTLNAERTIEICNALKNEGNITYDIQTRLMSLNNQKVLGALSESNCRWIEVGIETLSQKSLMVHKQGTNLTKIEEMLRRLRDNGLPVCSFIVNGLPEQTPDEMRESLDSVTRLLDKKLLHASYFFGLVPYPGSEMHRNPAKFGMTIKTHEYRHYNEDVEPVYDTKFATSAEMYKVFLEGVQQLGEAMDAKPYLGKELDEETLKKLGKSITHV